MAQRPSERRAEERIDVKLEATLSVAGAAHDCVILNVCSNGFLLQAHQNIRVGEVAELQVSLYPDQPITCTVQIKHVNADRRGAVVLKMSECDRQAYRTFVEAERASQMEVRARAGVC
jgi:hypothetical protein